MRNATPFILGAALALPAFGADAPATLAPADNLVAENVPAIPQSLADSVGRYSEFRSATFGGWHPTRRELIVTTRFGDTNQEHYLKFPGGDRRQLTFYPENTLSEGFPNAGGGESFVFTKDKGGDEFYQFFRYDLATGDTALLTDGKSRNTSLAWSHGGTRAAYVSSRRDGKDMDLWVLDSADPKADRLVAQASGGGWNPSDWSPDDKSILVLDYISANDSNLWLFDARSGTKTLLTQKPDGAQVSYRGAQFSRDGKGLYLSTDQDYEFQRIAYMDLATKKLTFLTPEIRHDVSELALSWDGKTLAYVVNEDGLGVLHLMDTATRKELLVPKLPNGVVRDLGWHHNNRDLAFELETDLSPSDVYSYDIAAKKLDRWTYSETGGLDTGNFARSQLIRWKSWDERGISGFLYRPPAKFSGKRPVIVNIHGGPESQYRPGYLGRNYYLVNELGVAMIYPNVRGSSGYGKTFVALDNGKLREGSYRDIEALFDWIKAQPDLDADRVLVTGGSYGGFMTLAVATNYNDRIRCSIDIVGPSNFVTFLTNTSGYRQDLRRVEYGDERDPDMRAFLEKIAPMNKAGNITKPMFVIQGFNDPRVPHTESEQMVATVRRNQTPVWYLMAKDEGHGFQKKKNRDYQFYASVLFMQQFLLN